MVTNFSNSRIQLYPLLRLALMFILGIPSAMAVYPIIPMGTGIIVLIGVITTAFFVKKEQIQTSLLFLAFFLLGFTLTIHSLDKLQASLPKDEIYYQAIVVNTPQIKGKILKMDLLILYENKVIKTKASLLRDTVEQRYKQLSIGDGIEAISHLETPKNYFSETNFNYRKWMLFHGFQAQTFIYYRDWRKCEVNMSSLSKWERTKIAALKWRSYLLKSCRLEGNDQTSSVIAAMLLGEKSGLSKQTKDLFSIAGGAHILALSGTHLGILFALLSLLFGGKKGGYANTLLTLVIIWCYTVLVGLSSSVMRSATMLTLLTFVQMLSRRAITLNSLSLAALILLYIHPLDLYDAGFQLSFLAVLSILLFEKPIEHIINEDWVFEHRLTKWIWQMTSVSLSAQVLTFPLIAYYFGRFSCYSLLTNLLVIPASMLIIILGILTIASLPIPVIHSFFGHALSFIAGNLNTSIYKIAQLPGASVENIHLNILQLILIYIVIAAISIISSKLLVNLK